MGKIHFMTDNVRIVQFILFTSKRPSLHIGCDDFDKYLTFIQGFLVSQGSLFLGKDYLENWFSDRLESWLRARHELEGIFGENLRTSCKGFVDFQRLVLAFCEEELGLSREEIDPLGNLIVV